MSATTRQPVPIPATAAAMRVPLWQRSQSRLRQRYGFDLNTPDALDRARSLVAEKPQDADRLLLHASVLAMRGDNSMAEGEVRRALEVQPDLARAHTTLATLLVQRGARDDGLQEARRAAELDGTDATVQYNLGLAEWASGHRREAKVAFNAAWQALYGDVHGPGRRPPWWRRVFRRGTVGAPQSTEQAQPDAQAHAQPNDGPTP